MNFTWKLICIVLIFFTFNRCTLNKTNRHNYYFNPLSGNDNNTGTSPSQAFKDLSKIKTLHIEPGDSILLKSGAVFLQQLYISCKGSPDHLIVIGKYGGSKRPYIQLDGSKKSAVHIFNSEYVVLRDLEISNKGLKLVDGLTGVLVELSNYRTSKDITLDNLYIHDVYGTVYSNDKGGGSAIFCRNFVDGKADSISSRFDGLTIENCLIKNCQRDGIMMWGNWIRSKWNPNLHVVIRNNVLDGVPGHGIVPVACDSPIVEYNIMKNCPAILPDSVGADGIWPWSCDNAIVQYNIVSDQSAMGDAFGFDADYNCNHSLFQYNLSFNNKGGFLLICNSGGWPKDWSAGNYGTIIRYNISINDGLRTAMVNVHHKKYFSPVINVTGPTENTLIEKNLFFLYKKPTPQVDKTLIDLTDWSGYPDSTFFKNNYISSDVKYVAVDSSKSTNNFFEGNWYTGDLVTPKTGFKKYDGNFNQSLWFDKSDPHWKKLLDFVKDKTIPLHGKKVPVLKILGVENNNW